MISSSGRRSSEHDTSLPYGTETSHNLFWILTHNYKKIDKLWQMIWADFISANVQVGYHTLAQDIATEILCPVRLVITTVWFSAFFSFLVNANQYAEQVAPS